MVDLAITGGTIVTVDTERALEMATIDGARAHRTG